MQGINNVLVETLVAGQIGLPAVASPTYPVEPLGHGVCIYASLPVFQSPPHSIRDKLLMYLSCTTELQVSKYPSFTHPFSSLPSSSAGL